MQSRVEAVSAFEVTIRQDGLNLSGTTTQPDDAEKIADGGPYIFPGRSAKSPLSNMGFLMLLRRIGQDNITAHGFRSTFRDWAAEKTNVPTSVCEAALAHVVKNKSEAAYFRSDLFALRRNLMDTWSRFATSKPADIVAIRA